jgi:hypothetical protein
LYLPRLRDPGVLLEASRQGLALLTWEAGPFAYADTSDDAAGRYRGLRAGAQLASLGVDDPGLLVRPGVARRQMDAERAAAPPVVHGEVAPIGVGVAPGGPPGCVVVGPGPLQHASPTRFHGSVALDPARVGRDASRIADGVIAHLAGLVGADVKVTLEIEAGVPAGVPENVVRTVTENSRPLRFTTHGFESG